MASVVWWLVAAVLVAGGLCVVLWEKVLRRGPVGRWCRGCGYAMSGVPGLVCPECGRGAKSEGELVRRRGRARPARVRAGVCAAVLGVGMGVFLWVDSLDGGWWRAAPTWVLLRIVAERDHEDVQRAISGRVRSSDPQMGIGVQRRLSERRWAELTAVCAQIVADPARSRKTRAWATVMLGMVIPNVELVDPVLESLLLSEDNEVRELALGGAYPYYLVRGRLGERWVDELVALAGSPEPSSSSVMAANTLARTWPLQVHDLRDVLAAVGEREDAAEVYDTIASGLASGVAWKRGGESVEDHLPLLKELESFGPEAAAVVERAMGLLREWEVYPTPERQRRRGGGE